MKKLSNSFLAFCLMLNLQSCAPTVHQWTQNLEEDLSSKVTQAQKLEYFQSHAIKQVYYLNSGPNARAVFTTYKEPKTLYHFENLYPTIVKVNPDIYFLFAEQKNWDNVVGVTDLFLYTIIPLALFLDVVRYGFEINEMNRSSNAYQNSFWDQIFFKSLLNLGGILLSFLFGYMSANHGHEQKKIILNQIKVRYNKSLQFQLKLDNASLRYLEKPRQEWKLD